MPRVSKNLTTFIMLLAGVNILVACQASFGVKAKGTSISAEENSEEQPATSGQDELSNEPPAGDPSFAFRIVSIIPAGGTDFLISWEEVAAADSYNIVIAKDNSCQSPVFTISVAKGNNQKLTLNDVKEYFACVFALIGSDKIGATNNGKAFSRAIPGESPEGSEQPPAGPSGQPVGQDSPEIVSFAWTPAAADGYINQSERASAAPLVIEPETLLTTERAFALIAAADSCDSAGSYSEQIPLTDISGMVNGNSYKICVRLTGSTGKITYGSTETSVTVDTTAPALAGFTDISIRSATTVNAAISGATNFSWQKISGPGSVMFGNGDTSGSTISADSDGSYTIRFTASDAAGNTVSDDFTMNWDATSPAIVSGFSATKGVNAVYLDWADSGGDVTGYILVRRVGSNPAWSPEQGVSYAAGSVAAGEDVIYAGTSSAFEDTTAAIGATYHYHVYAHDAVFNYPAAALVTGAINIPPSIYLSEPDGSGDTVGQTGSISIVWDDNDPDDNAQITLFYGGPSTGDCSGRTQLATGITENSDGSSDVFLWSPALIAAGSYYICARISDGIATVDVVSSGAITVNEKPTIALNLPANITTPVETGTPFDITWTDSDSDNNASIGIGESTGVLSECTPNIATGIQENDSANSYTWTTSSYQSDRYGICLVIDDSINTPQHVTSPSTRRVEIYRTCRWAGNVNQDFANPGNWTHCNGGAPTTYDRIVVDKNAALQPLVSSNYTIGAIGVIGTNGTGNPDDQAGGTITIADGATLFLSNSLSTHGVRSDIILRGATADCASCMVSATQIGVTNNAELRLGSGITLAVTNGLLVLGDGVNGGILTSIEAGSTASEQPRIISNGDFDGIRLSGSASFRSTLAVDGLRISGLGSGTTAIQFNDHFQIETFKNVTLDAQTGTGMVNSISFNGCTNAVFSDRNWTNIAFVDHAATNIDISACSGITPPITVSGSGLGFGDAYENDTNSVLDWTGSTSVTCTWKTDGSTDWRDPANWNNCINGRGNYPDQLDFAIIPAGGTQPTISGTHAIRGFAPGTGGGMVTIDNATRFRLRTTTSIRSDVGFQGVTADCTDCMVYPRTISSTTTPNISDNATLSLGTGVGLYLREGAGSRYFVFGNGTDQSGSLKTVHSSTIVSEWPRFTSSNGDPFTGVIFRGANGNLSSIDINGLTLENFSPHGYSHLELDAFYRVVRLDNLRFRRSGISGGTMLHFDRCDTADFVTKTFDDMKFEFGFSGIPVSVDISDATCSGMTGTNALTITGSADGTFGPLYERDPFNALDWE